VVNSQFDSKTDLFIAGDQGIGFFSSYALTRKPQIILPSIAFKQVAASERVDPFHPNDKSTFSIFAVSDSDELYYITGTRTFKGNVVTFATSGYPIRSNVSRMATLYNDVVGSFELVYAVNGQNSLRHLIRDPVTNGWNEYPILVPATGKAQKYPAYSTSITCTNGNGTPVPEDYPLQLSSESINAVVNGCTFHISNKPTAFFTDKSGQIRIITVADNSLGHPPLILTLTRFTDHPAAYTIDPMQRIVHILNKMKSGDDIKSARTASGVAVFTSEKSEHNANGCGAILAQFPKMVQVAEPTVAKQYLNVDLPGLSDFAVSLEKDESGKLRITGNDWIDNAINTAKRWVTDIIESFKHVVKSVFKFAFRVVAGVLELITEVEGTLIRFALKGIGLFMRTLANFLKEHLGLDISGLLRWLGFIFDINEIKKTQRVSPCNYCYSHG
jgi:hypothetical protein